MKSNSLLRLTYWLRPSDGIKLAQVDEVMDVDGFIDAYLKNNLNREFVINVYYWNEDVVKNTTTEQQPEVW